MAGLEIGNEPGDNEGSYCGPIAVSALAGILLLKFAALTVLLRETGPGPLLLIPPMARSGVALLFVTTPMSVPAAWGRRWHNMPHAAKFLSALWQYWRCFSWELANGPGRC